MTVNELLQIIIGKLGDNYKTSDSTVLSNILNEKIIQAENLSNRQINISIVDNNLKLLSPEIIEATIISYEKRGVEDSKSKSELGESSSYIDENDLLRMNIIKNGKRVIF